MINKVKNTSANNLQIALRVQWCVVRWILVSQFSPVGNERS